jgi:hypothetical protein
MAKLQPPNTVSHQLFLPIDLDKKAKMLAEYGKVDALIIECLEEAIGPRYEKWLKHELAKVSRQKQKAKDVQ